MSVMRDAIEELRRMVEAFEESFIIVEPGLTNLKKGQWISPHNPSPHVLKAATSARSSAVVHKATQHHAMQSEAMQIKARQSKAKT